MCLSGEDGLMGPRSGEGANLGDGDGQSTGKFFTKPCCRWTMGLEPEEDGSDPESGNWRSRLLFSCQNLAGTLIPRGATFDLGAMRSSGTAELLPDDMLSVSEEAERSAPSNDALRVPSSNTSDCCINRTVAKIESFCPKEQSKLLINGFDARCLAPGHRR